MTRPFPRRMWLACLCCLAISGLPQLGLFAQAAAKGIPAIGEADKAVDAGEDKAESPGPAPAAEVTKVWGSAWYSLGVYDKPGFASINDWTSRQYAGLSINLRSPWGLEILSDLSVQLNTITENTVNSVIQQLSIRFSPSDWLSVIVGKQRLKWGTYKIFAAIDKGEQRANPLDQRSVLSGLSGIKTEILPTDWLGFSLLIIPETEIRWSQAALRADFTLVDAGLDLGIGAIKYTYNPFTASFGSNGLPTADRLDRVALMLDAAWASGDISLYGEAELRWGRETGYWLPGMAAAETFSGDSRNLPVFRGLLGLMWQINLGLTRPVSLVAEYFYQGDGLNQAEANTFRGRYATGVNIISSWPAGSPAPSALLPSAFAGIGNFRQHYAGLALNSIALDRYLLLDINLIAGLDSGLLMGAVALSYEFKQGISLKLAWDMLGALIDENSQNTELTLTPFRNRITLAVSTSF